MACLSFALLVAAKGPGRKFEEGPPIAVDSLAALKGPPAVASKGPPALINRPIDHPKSGFSQGRIPCPALPFPPFSNEWGELLISGTITNGTAEKVANTCQAARKEGLLGVHVQVHSGGGSAEAALSIIGHLQMLSSICDVRMTAVGPCLSGGLLVLMAVPCERRYSTDGAFFLIHGSAMDGEIHDNFSRLDSRVSPVIGAENSIMLELLAKGTCVPRSELEVAFREHRDAIFGVEEALKLGVVGGIVPLGD